MAYGRWTSDPKAFELWEITDIKECEYERNIGLVYYLIQTKLKSDNTNVKESSIQLQHIVLPCRKALICQRG